MNLRIYLNTKYLIFSNLGVLEAALQKALSENDAVDLQDIVMEPCAANMIKKYQDMGLKVNAREIDASIDNYNNTVESDAIGDITVSGSVWKASTNSAKLYRISRDPSTSWHDYAEYILLHCKVDITESKDLLELHHKIAQVLYGEIDNYDNFVYDYNGALLYVTRIGYKIKLPFDKSVPFTKAVGDLCLVPAGVYKGDEELINRVLESIQ